MRPRIRWVSRGNSKPRTETSPPLGRSSPARTRSSVDFPEPFGPSTARLSPVSSLALTPASAARSPKARRSRRSSIAGRLTPVAGPFSTARVRSIRANLELQAVAVRREACGGAEMVHRRGRPASAPIEGAVGEEEGSGRRAAEAAEDDATGRAGGRRGGLEVARPDAGRLRGDLREQRLLAPPAVGDRRQLSPEPPEGAAGDAPGLVRDRPGFGDVIAP